MARLLVDVLAENRRMGRFLLHGFVIMPNHFHLLLTPPAEIPLEKALQFIKGGFCFRAKRENSFSWEIWRAGLRKTDRKFQGQVAQPPSEIQSASHSSNALTANVFPAHEPPCRNRITRQRNLTDIPFPGQEDVKGTCGTDWDNPHHEKFVGQIQLLPPVGVVSGAFGFSALFAV
jgi:hypothetical protein